MKINKDELLKAGLPDSGVIEDKITGHGRWSVGHEIIFKWKDGKFYSAHYSVGATENQDEGPWEYNSEVECEEVKQVEELIKIWKPLSELSRPKI